MFKQVDVDIVTLTPEYVQWFSQLPTLCGDRDRDGVKGRRHVAWLRRLFDDGMFMGPTWSIGILDGKKYRVDGGHSSRMLESVNRAFPQNLKASVRIFYCDTAEDMAELFDHFDNRNQIRTLQDKVKARKSVVPTYETVSPTAMIQILNGVAWYLSTVVGEDRVDEDAKVRLMHEYEPFVLFARPIVGKRWLQQVPVVAAMFATYRKNAEAAATFWNLVGTESAPSVTDPSRVLASFLRDALLDYHHAQRKWRPRDYYAKAIHAWNNWRVGSPLKMLKSYEGDKLPCPR